MHRKTISEPEIFNLTPYLSAPMRRSGDLGLEPNDGQGIRFIDPKTLDAVSIKGKLASHEGFDGRYITAQAGQTRFRVVEHLLSALAAASVTDVDVRLCNRTLKNCVPVIGPGIEPLYSRLLELKTPLEQEMPDVSVKESAEFNHGGGTIKIHPSNNLEMWVKTHHKDLVDLDPQPFESTDLYADLNDHRLARPVARLQKRRTKLIYDVASSVIRGITPETYIMTAPGEGVDKIVERMAPQYQEGRNEHCAHTAVADFLGELKALFPGKINARFEISGTANHTTRMVMLHQMLESGVFEIRLNS